MCKSVPQNPTILHPSHPQQIQAQCTLLCCHVQQDRAVMCKVACIPAGASSASFIATTWGSKSASDRMVKELSAPTKPTVQLVAVRSPSVILAEIACTSAHSHAHTQLSHVHTQLCVQVLLQAAHSHANIQLCVRVMSQA